MIDIYKIIDSYITYMKLDIKLNQKADIKFNEINHQNQFLLISSNEYVKDMYLCWLRVSASIAWVNLKSSRAKGKKVSAKQ